MLEKDLQGSMLFCDRCDSITEWDFGGCVNCTGVSLSEVFTSKSTQKKDANVVFAYKIRNKITGLFSCGEANPRFTKSGKVWSQKGHVKSHLTNYAISWYGEKRTIPEEWEVVLLTYVNLTQTSSTSSARELFERPTKK